LLSTASIFLTIADDYNTKKKKVNQSII